LAQTSKLPYKGFHWLSEADYSSIEWDKVDTETNDGYVLEVDLSYPKNLHKKHSNLPLAPENVEITFENLSETAQSLLVESGSGEKFKDVKLLSTFYDRVEYVVHFKLLKLYLQLGMKLLKIHRVVKFKQAAFIKPFIDKCTQYRQISKTKFEQDQFKKLANSVYGKTIQNPRNYVRVKLHTNALSLKKAVSHISFKNFSIIADDFVQTSHSLSVIEHKQPLFIGFTILELSKHFMFDFFYNKMTKNLKCELKLGMTDTDSFLFYVSDKKEFQKHMAKFMDYSNYPEDHPQYSLENKSKLGFFKNELGGKLFCKEFVGLRSKCYAMKLKDVSGKHDEKKVCKGLGRVAIRNRLKFKHYKSCLFEQKAMRFDYNTINSRSHVIRTVRINKKALNFFDSKRWMYQCQIHSEPYGSSLLKTREEKCRFCK